MKNLELSNIEEKELKEINGGVIGVILSIAIPIVLPYAIKYVRNNYLA